MEKLTSAILAIVAGAFALAMLSVLVSKSAQTPQVLQSSGSALAAIIAAAVNPVTMNNPTSNGNNVFSSPLNSSSTAAEVSAFFS